ncbi:MAG: hypothetical protein QM777_24795 [Pseudorhodoferax sp.]
MTASTDHDLAEAGRRLGHDIHTGTRWPRLAGWPAAVREGFDAAAHARLPRAAPDRFARKWLQLRLGALRRGRVVDEEVTPALLRALDVTHCPVTREPLTHGAHRDTDWSIDRLNNDAAYAAGNLAVMSVRANRAKGARSFEEVLVLAGLPQATAGLAPREWLRLATLMLGPAFATRHGAAPALPLCAPLPCRSTRLALQQIQRLLTLQTQRPDGKNRLVRDFRPACRTERAMLRLRTLADAVHEGLKRLPADAECWDVWLQPGLMPALQAWRDTLDAPGWACAARIAGQLAGARRETAQRLQAWRLPSRGYHAALPPALRQRPVTDTP